MKYFVIGDEDTIIGFRLVGVEGRVVESILQAKEAFKVAVSTQDVGVILITEKIAQKIREEIEPYIYESTFPLVLEIPDRQGVGNSKKSLTDLIEEAVGINI